MLDRLPIRWLTLLTFVASLGTGCSSSHTADTPHVLPAPPMPALAVAPLGWGAIERRVRRGVSRGVATFHLDPADREDVAAMAMERAWRAFRSGAEPIRHPEAWGRTIAVRVGLDEVRRQRRERQRLAACVDAEVAGDHELLEPHLVRLPDPFEGAVAAERRALLLERIGSWPAAERRLAELLLEGRAETVTAAAWLYRAEEEARGEGGSMYPLKARTLLEARRGELEELV